MKTLIFSLSLTAAILASTFAQAASKTEKLLGQCTMTQVKIAKSKHEKTGTFKTNDAVQFVITEYLNDGKDAIYDSVSMHFGPVNANMCPIGDCDLSTIKYKSYDNPANGPMLDGANFKVNTEKKVDVLFINKEQDYEWTKLKYDFTKKIGTFESREKINGWSGTTSNEHIIREIRNCTFKGPLNLDPHQP